MDPASIPQIMQIYFGVIQPLALVCALALSALGILEENTRIFTGQTPNYAGHIFKVVAVFIGIFMYKTIFLSIVCLFQVISFLVFSMEDWGRIQVILNNFQVSGSLLTISIDKVFLFGAKYLSTLIEEIFMVVRYAFLSVLYMIGPFAFVFALYNKTSGIIKGWFKNVFEISFWIVVLRILQSVYACAGMLGINSPDSIPPSQYLILTVTYIVLVILVPVITSKIVSGGLLSPLASIAIGAATSLATYAGGHAARLCCNGADDIIEGAISLSDDTLLSSSTGKGTTDEIPIAPKQDIDDCLSSVSGRDVVVTTPAKGTPDLDFAEKTRDVCSQQ
jgi:hypothetical protein